MKGLLLTVAVIGILAMVITRRGSAPADGASPAPTTVTGQIAFRDQAGLALRVRAQIDAMKRFEAMGSTAALSSVLEGNQALLDDREPIAERQRQAGGDASPPAGWDEFLRRDAQLRQAVP